MGCNVVHWSDVIFITGYWLMFGFLVLVASIDGIVDTYKSLKKFFRWILED
jgi:hypothetical protein